MSDCLKFLCCRYRLLLFSGWCFTHQYKNTTQFCFYAGLAATQNTKSQNTAELAANLWKQIKSSQLSENDINPDDLIEPGWYNAYTSINGLKYRWLIHVETLTGESLGGIYWRRQIAYHYMGGPYTTPPHIRHICSIGNSWGYTSWFTLGS